MIESVFQLSTKKLNMVNHGDLIERDLKHIWHPCSQMKDFEQCPPLVVQRAAGSILYTNRGPIIDAISSWWCKRLGHNHPEITAAITNQLSRFEHAINANTTYPELVELAEFLHDITKKQHLFFASDGSCAVEIAMKLALQGNQLKGKKKRQQFITLKNSYHGETLATLEISDLGLYKKPFEAYNQGTHHLDPIPYVSGQNDPVWKNASAHWASIKQQLEARKDTTAAIVIEPILQGAAGMRCYSPEFLKQLRQWTTDNDIYLIADEIMTAFGLTGKWLACEHAGIEPDMICLSKGLTAGTLPLSCVLIDSKIYTLFYDDYETGKAFLHSHTHSGNALAVSSALATLKIMKRDNINERAAILHDQLLDAFEYVSSQSGKLDNIRSIGGVVAGDLITPPEQRLGFAVYQEALKKGALLRPLGNTLYWMPPLTTDESTVSKLAEITLQSIEKAYAALENKATSASTER